MSAHNGRVFGRVRRARLVRALRRVEKPAVLRRLIAGFVRPLGVGRNRARSTNLGPTFRKGVPSWSLLVLLLLGAGVGFYASTIIGQATGQKGSSFPDFTVGSVPSSLSVPQGGIASFVIGFNSLNGFAGSVNLIVSSSPTIVNATLALNPQSVSLLTGSATATLTIPIPTNESVNDYLLSVGASSGRTSHNVILILQVTPPPLPDFQLQAGQSSINVTRGSSASTTIVLTSIGGFSGLVSLSSSISPGGGSSPTLGVNPIRVTLLSGGTASVLLSISTSGSTNRGMYTITVQGINGSLSNTVTVSLTVQ